MNQTQDTNLDPQNSPLLLFDYSCVEPEGETDIDLDPSEENEHDDSVNQEKHGAEKSDYENEDDDEPNDALFFYSITRRNLQTRRLEDLEGHFYWITPQGWFLMLHRDSHATYLWNPFTGQRINLPSDQEQFLTKSTTRCLLSHKPTDPNCIVLVVNCRDTVFWYCHPEGNRWFKHTYQSSMLAERRRDVIGGMEILTAVGGEFYTYFTDNVVILKFLPDPTFTKIPVGDKSNHAYPSEDSFLLESCGELFSLDFDRPCFIDKVVHVGVHRLDMAERAWLKVETLGDRVFFVNFRYFGASLSAQKLGLKGNCIYFLRLGDKGLYVYDMERGTTALHNPSQDLLDDVAPEILMPPS
ncbi:unnamed protein product [Alopecurus aequalis]